VKKKLLLEKEVVENHVSPIVQAAKLYSIVFSPPHFVSVDVEKSVCLSASAAASSLSRPLQSNSFKRMKIML
jgi:hypothetical protein